jgi:hypothetical protein
MEIDDKVYAEMAAFIQEATPLVKESMDKQAEAKALEAKIPSVVESMVTNGFLTADQREKAASALQNPAKALEILQRVAVSAGAKKEASVKTSLGTPDTPTKTASVGEGADAKFLTSFGLR